jgi:hypothetical protein
MNTDGHGWEKKRRTMGQWDQGERSDGVMEYWKFNRRVGYRFRLVSCIL